MDAFVPCLTVHRDGPELAAITLGHPLLDDYLAFVAARARTNTWLAVASDLKVFFGVVGKPPAQVSTADVFAFLSAQRAPRRGERVVRLDDGEAAWRRARLPGACRACGACMRIWLLAAMPAWPAIRCPAVSRRVVPADGVAMVACR